MNSFPLNSAYVICLGASVLYGYIVYIILEKFYKLFINSIEKLKHILKAFEIQLCNKMAKTYFSKMADTHKYIFLMKFHFWIPGNTIEGSDHSI